MQNEGSLRSDLISWVRVKPARNFAFCILNSALEIYNSEMLEQNLESHENEDNSACNLCF